MAINVSELRGMCQALLSTETVGKDKTGPSPLGLSNPGTLNSSPALGITPSTSGGGPSTGLLLWISICDCEHMGPIPILHLGNGLLTKVTARAASVHIT